MLKKAINNHGKSLNHSWETNYFFASRREIWALINIFSEELQTDALATFPVVKKPRSCEDDDTNRRQSISLLLK